MGNIVAIVGRPNVGKSTLFNRLIGERQAIIDDVSGVTRDRQYGHCEWNGRIFTVVDTGGFVQGSEDVFEKAIRTQVKIAIDEATAVIFMVDCETGITNLDQEMADILRRTKTPVYLAVNKVDNFSRISDATEFWSLGFENLYEISSVTGSGTGDLLDVVVAELPDEDSKLPDLPKFAIVGQPNVGKSSLTNALLGEERNIVTEIAGTTRDAIHSVYSKYDKEFILIDTAGIRKKARVHEDLEFYSVMRAIQAIDESDICILMIDARAGVESQDMSIFKLAQKRNKGIVLLVNKWDLVEKETNTARDFEKEIRRKISPFSDVPIVFMSVLEKQRIFKAIEAALEVYENRSRKISTSQLNEAILPEIEKHPPPANKGKFINIKYITQLPLHYPVFAFFCSNPKYIRDSYKQYLENKMREHFNFTGTPISLVFKEK